MPILVSYDIEDDRLRTRAANKLLEWGFFRLQKSVFIGEANETQWKNLFAQLEKNVLADAAPTDLFLHLRLTKEQARDFYFWPRPPDDWAALIDPPTTLFI